MDNSRFGKALLGFIALGFLAGCGTNPATGRQEFNGLMSPQQENALGAAEHEKIIAEYGGVYHDNTLQTYVNDIGQRMAAHSERPDVVYHFTLLDSPVVNAFALPGGYVYITRGAMAVANDEEELAAVLGHEVGHVAARHQAARYSQGVVAQLGAGILDAVVGSSTFSQAVNLGTNLYMSSYSRDQESEADKLGVRYLSRTGYNPLGMSRFLADMENTLNAEAGATGKSKASFDYFSSHPDTGKRVVEAQAIAAQYPAPAKDARNNLTYLSLIDGMTYGDGANPKDGFVRGQNFYHPDLGFAIAFPAGYAIANKPDMVVATGRDGGGIALDFAARQGGQPAEDYLTREWLNGRMGSSGVEHITINGMDAATTQVQQAINNQIVDVRLIAIEYSPQDIVRLQILIPRGASAATIDNLKSTTYSFRRLDAADKRNLAPYQVHVVKARAGDTAASMAARMPDDVGGEALFRAINAIAPGQALRAGQPYKVIY